MDSVEDLFQRLQSCTRSEPKALGQNLFQLLRLDPQMNPFVVRLNNLGELSETQLLASIEKRNWFNGDWSAFGNLVMTFVKLCNKMNPWSALESFDLYTTYLNDITIAFMNKTWGYVITPLLEDVLKQVLSMAKHLDNVMLMKEMYRKPRLNFMASILLRIFNNIRSQIGSDDHVDATKKSIMLLIGVKLCQTYFHLSNPLLCQNVFTNMGNANLTFGFYHPNQQIQYRFFLAKFYMAKYDFVDAFEHLQWCLGHVPANYAMDNVNVTKILDELLPVSILLGKRPKLGTFSKLYYSSPSECPKHFVVYAQLGDAIKTGNFFKLHTLIDDTEIAGFLKVRELSAFFGSKAFLLTLGNLVRRIWLAEGKQLRLHYDAMKIGLSMSLNGLDLTSVSSLTSSLGFSQGTSESFLSDQSVENCLVTLIDQNLLRGKVFPRLRVVSLAKNDVFPDVFQTYCMKYGNGAVNSSRSPDQWIMSEK